MNSIETVQQRETALKIKTILVAVDLSSHSERTVAYAVPIARQFGASLKVIHVYVPPNGTEFGAQDMCRLLEKDRDDAERSLASLVDRVRAEFPRCESILRTGDVPEQIASAASLTGANLIVVGRHHQTFLGRILNLDQAPKIVQRVACPVLVCEDEDNRPEEAAI
jgi:nucleotide-binding universal stress UspA family protein